MQPTITRPVLHQKPAPKTPSQIKLKGQLPLHLACSNETALLDVIDLLSEDFPDGLLA